MAKLPKNGAPWQYNQQIVIQKSQFVFLVFKDVCQANEKTKTKFLMAKCINCITTSPMGHSGYSETLNLHCLFRLKSEVRIGQFPPFFSFTGSTRNKKVLLVRRMSTELFCDNVKRSSLSTDLIIPFWSQSRPTFLLFRSTKKTELKKMR